MKRGKREGNEGKINKGKRRRGEMEKESEDREMKCAQRTQSQLL